MTTYNILESPAFILDRCVHLMRSKCRKILQEVGSDTTVEEFSLLVLLLSSDGSRVKDLAQKMRRDATTITRQLDGLAKKNFIKRESDNQDRRAILIRLTEEGRNEIGVAWERIMNYRRHTVHDISQSDLEITLRTVKQMQENLETFKVRRAVASQKNRDLNDESKSDKSKEKDDSGVFNASV